MKLQAENHTILPESCSIIAISWDTDQDITLALQEIPASPQYPLDKSYLDSNFFLLLWCSYLIPH